MDPGGRFTHARTASEPRGEITASYSTSILFCGFPCLEAAALKIYLGSDLSNKGDAGRSRAASWALSRSPGHRASRLQWDGRSRHSLELPKPAWEPLGSVAGPLSLCTIGHLKQNEVIGRARG